jgi:hypothetical protein
MRMHLPLTWHRFAVYRHPARFFLDHEVATSAVIHPAGHLLADWGFAPIPAFGDTPASLRRAALTAEAAGLLLAASMSLEGAEARLDKQLTTGAVWLELDEGDSSVLEPLLARLQEDASADRYAVVAAVPRSQIDVVFARLTAPTIQILVDRDDVERATALAVAVSGMGEARRCPT